MLGTKNMWKRVRKSGLYHAPQFRKGINKSILYNFDQKSEGCNIRGLK